MKLKPKLYNITSNTLLIYLLFFVFFFNSQEILCIENKSDIKYKDSIYIDNYIIKSDYLRYSNPDSSKHILEHALALSREGNFYVQEGTILNRIGGRYYILGKYDLAMDYFSQAFEIFSGLNYKQGIATSYNNMAMIYGVKLNLKKAVQYHKLSIEMCKELNDLKLLSTNYYNLGILYNESNRNDSALIFANMAIELNKKINLPEENIRIYNLKARIYTNTGNFKHARQMFDMVLNQNDTIKYRWDYNYAHDGLALLYYEQGNYKKSIEYGRKALMFARELKTPWDIQSAAIQMAKSFKKLNQYDSAYYYLMLNKLYNDSILSNETKSHIEYVELKNSQIKNDQLVQEAKRQQEILDFNKRFMWLMGLSTIILLALFILYLYKNHQKRILSKKLKYINVEILKNNKELEQLNTTKDLIFRVIAHDLMGPIGNVISFTDFMNKEYGSLSKEKIQEIIHKLNVTTIQTYNLLDNLLHWARVQMDESNINIIPFYPVKSVSRILKTFASSLKDKNIELEVNINDEIKVDSDEVIFQIIIRNLLANAIKFTNTGGKISICAIKSEHEVEFKVSDDGVGIEELKLKLLFNSKPLQSTLGTKGEKGSGIGLVLCNEFVNKLNGRIWAESKPGAGSSFFFTIPL